LTKHLTNHLKSASRFSRSSLTIFAIIFAAIGGYIIYNSFAAGFSTSFEAENSTKNSPAAVVTDASASGGSALKFTTAGSCALSTPNVPDGPDPWGGCFPGPSNTGAPAGTTLTNYTDSCSITTADKVIDSKLINCDLDIRATGVIIKNSMINGMINSNQTFGTIKDAVTVMDTTIDGGLLPNTTTDARGIEARHFTVLRVEFIRGKSGAFCEYYCKIQDSWVHGQDTDESGVAHESGFRLGSGTTTNAQEFLHNSILCDAQPVAPDAGCSADISGYGDFATIENNYVYRNLILSPGNKAATCAYGGSSASKPNPNGTNNVYSQNVFQRRGPGLQCAEFFSISDLNAGVRGNQFIGNMWNDGSSFAVPDDN
jgi:hypothetical protein